jgi:hypothetical protein
MSESFLFFCVDDDEHFVSESFVDFSICTGFEDLTERSINATGVFSGRGTLAA